MIYFTGEVGSNLKEWVKEREEKLHCQLCCWKGLLETECMCNIFFHFPCEISVKGLVETVKGRKNYSAPSIIKKLNFFFLELGSNCFSCGNTRSIFSTIRPRKISCLFSVVENCCARLICWPQLNDARNNPAGLHWPLETGHLSRFQLSAALSFQKRL